MCFSIVFKVKVEWVELASLLQLVPVRYGHPDSFGDGSSHLRVVPEKHGLRGRALIPVVYPAISAWVVGI